MVNIIVTLLIITTCITYHLITCQILVCIPAYTHIHVCTTCLPKTTVPHFRSHRIVARHASFRCWRIWEVSFNFLLSKYSFLVICFCFCFPQHSIFFTQPIQIISVLFLFFKSSGMFVPNSFFTAGQGTSSFFVNSSFLGVRIVPTLGWICQCRRRGWRGWRGGWFGRNCCCG